VVLAVAVMVVVELAQELPQLPVQLTQAAAVAVQGLLLPVQAVQALSFLSILTSTHLQLGAV
jgi:hypothetical protein